MNTTRSTGGKLFLAALGSIGAVQSTAENQFDVLVTRGDEVKKTIKTSIKPIRTRVEKQYVDAKDQLAAIYDSSAKRIESVSALSRLKNARQRIAVLLNIPTSRDVDALHTKIDRILKNVAA